MSTKTFWLEETDQMRLSLRRYKPSEPGDARCPVHGYHSRIVVFHPMLPAFREDNDSRHLLKPPAPTDPRWPSHCDCGYAFQPDDERQIFPEHLYRAADGQYHTLRAAPVGAMWDARWMRGEDGRDLGYTGPDGISLVVKTPGGDWMVDSQASNCTRDQWSNANNPRHPTAQRFDRTHYCWPRIGDPVQGTVDVRKEHGETCSAGAGSIQCGAYHGFLHHGVLT